MSGTVVTTSLVEKMAEAHWDAAHNVLRWRDLAKGVKSFQIDKMQAALAVLAHTEERELTRAILQATAVTHG